MATRNKTYGPLVVFDSTTANNLQDTSYLTRGDGAGNNVSLTGLPGDSNSVKGLYRTFDYQSNGVRKPPPDATAAVVDNSDWRDRFITAYIAWSGDKIIYPGGANDDKPPQVAGQIEFYSGAGGVVMGVGGGLPGAGDASTVLGYYVDPSDGKLYMMQPEGFTTGWAKATNQLKRRS